jgi:hypothetical protein
MKKQMSFSNLERKYAHELRNKINHSENVSDLRRLFQHTVSNFLLEVFEEEDFTIREEDIQFVPEHKKYYSISDELQRKPAFKKIWDNSDLPDLLHRFSKAINNHYVALNKHNERTEKKIRSH